MRYIGVSESSAANIRAGHAVHPLSAVQLEWSLWSRDAEVSEGGWPGPGLGSVETPWGAGWGSAGGEHSCASCSRSRMG